MTIQDWGAIGEILGAVATIATLIYLALQIRQNTRALKAAGMDSTIQTANDIRTSLFSDPQITEIYRRGLQNVEDLDDVERERFRLIMTNALWAFWNTYTQAQLGGRKAWDSQKNIARRFLSEPGGAWFWETYRGEFDAEFQREIDSVLSGAA